MVRTLPPGVIYLDAVVERIARTTRNGNLYPTIVYRDEAAAAWRKLCALTEDHVRPLMLTVDGFIQKADRTQFVGFADKYWKFASVLRYPPNGEGVHQEVNEHCPSHNLLDESGRLHRGARLVFLESEIETAFGRAPELLATGAPAVDEAPADSALPRKRCNPQIENARRAVNELYPDGDPGQDAAPNAILCRNVGKWLKTKGLPDVSKDTILRAIGRRK